MDESVLRILDANANRAREALRVMEDYARFGLDDAQSSERLKKLRHQLTDAISDWPRDQILAARGVAADVGRAISTESESHRVDAEHVGRAAAARLSESLRSLEEFAKIQHAELARRFEAMRYAGYEIEQRLFVGANRRKRLREARIHVLMTEATCRRGWRETAAAALAGGADVLQLREKSLTDRELLRRAAVLRDLTRQARALLVINDRPDLAVLADADGVHVGQDDLAPAEARRIVGPNRIVGVSTHEIAQVRAAMEAGPDYVAVGPMFQSGTKPQSRIPGPSFLREAIDTVAGAVPVVSIGGIAADRVDQIAAAGGRSIAVTAAVAGADDPRAAVDALRRRLA